MIDELGGLFGAATFVVFGAVLLEPALSSVTWAIAGYAVLSLTIVRMAPVAIAMVGTHARLPTLGFLGWFGPRGLASIVFTVIVLEESHLPNVSTMATVVVFTIVLSVYAHGVSSRPLAGRYASWYAAHPPDRPPRMEAVSAEPQRWRRPTAAG